MIITYACIFLLTLYVFVILNYWLAWKAIPIFQRTQKTPRIKFSVIVPARNEEKNIGSILNDLRNQNYPSSLYEIIVVDDHSNDNTADIVKAFPNIKLVQLSNLDINSYKKKAIEAGIMVATNEWIITTDADCRVTAEWLTTLSSFIDEKKPTLVAGPVYMHCDFSTLQRFQAIDFLILQGITGAAIHKNMHSMGNGANLAYRKDVFEKVNGFSGIDHIASGDDMLLLYKIWKLYPEKIAYLKSPECIVTTETEKTVKSFFQQRIRWASKAKKYQDKRIFPILLMVWLFNFSFFFLLFAGFWNVIYWLLMLGMFILKIIVELPFIFSVTKFFGKESLVKSFILIQPLHIVYTVFSGLLGQFGKYEWKGRVVK